ncbi:MAG: hypothetical protein MRZ79_05050 [Bacteroidia bacterium]|nr:hypothetical protein [Bacteroidia bacterium]
MALRTFLACISIFFMLACKKEGRQADEFVSLPAWRETEISGKSGSYLKFVCKNDSLFLAMGNEKHQHAIFQGPCELNLRNIPELEFVNKDFAVIRHLLENHDWYMEAFAINGPELTSRNFQKPLAYSSTKNLVVIPDTHNLSALMILNLENSKSQIIDMYGCVIAGNPLPCIMGVEFTAEDSLTIWREGEDGLFLDSIKIAIKI